MSKETGGPAFPTTFANRNAAGAEGMTLRDYFAAKAMQAAFTGVSIRAEDADRYVIAALAYKLADAMLKARES